MNKSNRFSDKFAKKSNYELEKIIDNNDYQKEAQLAAAWELERREKIPQEDDVSDEESASTSPLDEPSLYAGFWPRLGSLLLDAFILIPINIGLSYIGGFNKSIFTVVVLLQIVIILFFHVWMVWKYGGSPGKLITGIKVIRMDGEDVTRHNAQLRYLVDFGLAILSTITSYSAMMALSNEDFASLSFMQQGQYVSSYNPTLFSFQIWITNIWVWGELIVLLTNKRKRAIHDFIAGTVVVKKSSQHKIKELMK